MIYHDHNTVYFCDKSRNPNVIHRTIEGENLVFIIEKCIFVMKRTIEGDIGVVLCWQRT